MASSTDHEDAIDFDEEGRKLLALMNLSIDDVAGVERYRNLDAIWKHPLSGAILYVGDNMAARELGGLKKKNICRVVNCTTDLKNYHEKINDAGVTYLRFDVSSLAYRKSSRNDLKGSTSKLFEFVEEGLNNGESVLVHCLAGAHRAGTTGVCLLM